MRISQGYRWSRSVGSGYRLLHAAHRSQHVQFEQHGGHLRDALFQLGHLGVHGGAGLINLVAKLRGVRLHRTGSSKPFRI